MNTLTMGRSVQNAKGSYSYLPNEATWRSRTLKALSVWKQFLVGIENRVLSRDTIQEFRILVYLENAGLSFGEISWPP